MEIKKPLGLPDHLKKINRTLIMGILNVTPNSFSDGGEFVEIETAIEHARKMYEHGADIIDVGGESTRPGVKRVSCEEELQRVIPVIEQLAILDIPASVDTMRSQVACEAVSAGAVLVNDVSGGLADSLMYQCVAEKNVPFVVMHWRGHSVEMDRYEHYDHVLSEVMGELSQSLQKAVENGVDHRNLIIDPGLGFSKNGTHNKVILSQVQSFHKFELPLLIGASRKRFLGEILSDENGVPRDVLERDFGTHAITVLAAYHGVWCVRVHDVKPSADAVRVVREIYTKQELE